MIDLILPISSYKSLIYEQEISRIISMFHVLHNSPAKWFDNNTEINTPQCFVIYKKYMY